MLIRRGAVSDSCQREMPGPSRRMADRDRLDDKRVGYAIPPLWLVLNDVKRPHTPAS